MKAQYPSLFVLTLALPLVSCRFVGGKPDFSVMGDAFSPAETDTVYIESKPHHSTPIAASLPKAPAAVPAAAPAPVAPPPAPAPLAATAPAPQPAPAPAPNGIYTVCPGDTLSRIARNHGVSLSNLAAANGMSLQSAIIKPGQQLRIPQAGSTPPAVATAKPAAAAPKPVATPKPKPVAAPKPKPVAKATIPGQYRVCAGDTLYRIARNHGITLRELLRANNLDEAAAHNVRVGTILTIPAQH